MRLVTFLAGNMFGDVAFVDGEPRSADAGCDEKCRVMVLDLDGFKSSSVNYKISLWDPRTNGGRYLPAVVS